MGWIVPSLGSLAAGAADDAILRERRTERRRRGRTPSTPGVDELALIAKITRVPTRESHTVVIPVKRVRFRG